MATQHVTLCTSAKPTCAFVPDAPVALILQDSALIVQSGNACCDSLTSIPATICAASSIQQGCQNYIYQYTFSFDDELLADPDRGLLASDIVNFICLDYYTNYLEENTRCIVGDRFCTLYSLCGAETEGTDVAVLASYDVTPRLLSTHGQRLDIYGSGTWEFCVEEGESDKSFSLDFSLVAVIDGVDYTIAAWSLEFENTNFDELGCVSTSFEVRGRIGAFCPDDEALSVLNLSGSGLFGQFFDAGTNLTISYPGVNATEFSGAFTDITIELRTSGTILSGGASGTTLTTDLTAFTVDFIGEPITAPEACCES